MKVEEVLKKLNDVNLVAEFVGGSDRRIIGGIERSNEQDLKINCLEQNINHNFAELRSSLNHIIDHLTKISDLPEE